MRSSLFFILGTALLAACSPATPSTPTPPASAAVTPVPTQAHLPNVDWLAYHDPTVGFSIQHPLTWQQSQGEGYPVVFTLTAAPGTTLINKTMEINVTPDAKICNEGTYLSDTGSTSPQPVTVRGLNFLRETGSGIGAGNIYNWTGYSTLKGTTCITITFVLHSANAGVYSTEPASFDKAAESQIFDQLLNTFKLDP